MDKDLKKLKPELLWTRFSEICAVPRPSHHEEKIREYIIDFAKRHNLDYTVDAGPTIKYPHSPDEKVNIASVEKFWKFLCHTLETIPVK